MNEKFWNERYSSREKLFTGEPNGVLVTEVTDVPPGRALDAGCGEGADALWLARRGWLVTAVDISNVALQRAVMSGTETNQGQTTFSTLVRHSLWEKTWSVPEKQSREAWGSTRVCWRSRRWIFRECTFTPLRT